VIGTRPKTGGPRRLLALCLLMAVAALLAAPTSAAASGEGDGGGKSDGAAAEDAATKAVAAAEAAVDAEPSVAAVLAGKDATVEASSWGGDSAEPVGTTLVYRWTAVKAATVSEDWPLLRSGDGTPVAPFDSSAYHIRASEVSALRVDVLADGARILQILPVDGETRFTLEEQTWSPFSWFPWFTADPWVFAPVFVVLAVLLMARAWRRSRAWNRRLPSMTRHDRQFIGRLAVLLFLLAGFAWQFYEGWYAATGPSVGSSTTSADSLATLPLLLIPPGLFVAGLILELSSAPRRGSWALLAILSGAASAYFLASAMTGATTNLNLAYYILLAVLALISIPRAFSAGKMGWSRNAAPRYG
jgi:hypothetical protein